MASVSMRVCPRQVGSVPPDSQLRIHTTFTCIQCTAVFFVEKMQKYKIQHTPKIHKYKIHKLRKDSPYRYSAQNSHRLHLPPLHLSCVLSSHCTACHCTRNIVQCTVCTLYIEVVSIVQCTCHICHTASCSSVKGCHT